MTNSLLNKQLQLENLIASGSYHIIFRDEYQISKSGIIDLFIATVEYLGPFFVSALGIKIGVTNLISHVRSFKDKKVQFPITEGCYLYVKFDEQEAVEIIYRIACELAIDCILLKGTKPVFTISKESNHAAAECPLYVVEPEPETLADSNGKTPRRTKASVESKISPLDYRRRITTVRTSNLCGHKAPHKAVLMLSVIELIARGKKENRFEFDDELRKLFEEKWDAHVNAPVYSVNLASPFVCLANDSFWHLKLNGNVKVATTSPSDSWIRNNVEFAYLDEQLFSILRGTDQRRRFIAAIIKAFKFKD